MLMSTNNVNIIIFLNLFMQDLHEAFLITSVHRHENSIGSEILNK